MENHFHFDLLTQPIISKRYSEQSRIEALQREFADTGYVKLPSFFASDCAQLIVNSLGKLHKIRRRKDFVMPGYATPRNLSVVNGREIVDTCFPLALIYNNWQMRNVISEIVNTSLYPVCHQYEFMVANFMDGDSDTHGWHLDDPRYALIIISNSPPATTGGAALEFIKDWRVFRASYCSDSNLHVQDIVELARQQGRVQTRYHDIGDAYLLNAGECLHRVSPVQGAHSRQALNLAYHDTPIGSYLGTADILYGEIAHAQ